MTVVIVVASDLDAPATGGGAAVAGDTSSELV